MNKPTAKEYLSQAENVEREIRVKLRKAQRLRELLASVPTAKLNEVRIKSTVNIRHTEDAVAKLVDMETEINSELNELVRLKHEIAETIAKLENPMHRTVLELRYICLCKWSDVAVELQLSASNVYELHNRALSEIEFLINNENSE